jgi:hypothetical protein
MRIVFIGYNDCANVMTEWCNILKQHHKCIIICQYKHIFNYKLQHDLDLNKHKINIKNPYYKLILNADLIIFEDRLLVKTAMNNPNYYVKHILGIDIKLNMNKVVLWCPGSFYRTNYNIINTSLYKKIIVAPDLIRLKSNNNIHSIYPPPYNINNDNIENKINNEKIIILHSPSNRLQKGSDIIQKVLTKINNNRFEYIEIQGDNEIVMENKKKSLIYIDQICTCNTHNNCVGCFGVASIEALATGNIVLTTLHNYNNMHFNEFDDIPIIDTGITENDLEIKIIELLEKTDDELLYLSKKNIEWYNNNMNNNKIYDILMKKLL